MKTFESLCANTKEPEARQRYCQLVEQQRKAEQVMNDFKSDETHS